MPGPRAMRPGRHAALLAGVVATVLAGLALVFTHHSPRPPVAPQAAVAAALHDRQIRQALAGSHWTRASASPLDGGLERVDFWAGSQVQVEAAVDAQRHVVQEQDFHSERVPYGNWVAYEPVLLIGLSAVFLLVTLVLPWRRLRNLDAIAALSLVLSVVLFQHRYLAPSLLTAGPGLLYLATRCAWRGVGPVADAAPCRPLSTVLASGLGVDARIRWLRVALGVLALTFAMVAVSSPFPVDVAYAVMEGATALIHGVLPYGHMPPGILHSDTYPILSYALYTPLALLAPVRSLWDSVDAALAAAVLAALVAAGAAWRSVAGERGPRSIGGERRPRSVRGERKPRRPPEAEEAGLRAALAVLAFPPVLITASTGTTDIVLAALVALALLLWRRPAAAAGTLAVAGWFKLVPFALLPAIVAPLRGRRLAAALGAVAAVSAGVLAGVVAVGGVHGVGQMVHAVGYQFTRGSLQSLWSALGIGWAQPIAEAVVIGFIAAAATHAWRRPELASDSRRMAATCAAILLGVQLAANYWAFLYVVWVVPLLAVALFEPGLAVHRRRLARVLPHDATHVPALAA